MGNKQQGQGSDDPQAQSPVTVTVHENVTRKRARIPNDGRQPAHTVDGATGQVQSSEPQAKKVRFERHKTVHFDPGKVDRVWLENNVASSSKRPGKASDARQGEHSNNEAGPASQLPAEAQEATHQSTQATKKPKRRIASKAAWQAHKPAKRLWPKEKPAYIRTDEDIGRQLDELYTDIEEFTKIYFSFAWPKVDGEFSAFDRLLAEMSPELVRIAGCICVGGANGKEGWEELFRDRELRQAVVCGIIGRVLKEHVFGSLLFGADPEQLEALHRLEARDEEMDGFYRTTKRGKRVKTLCPLEDSAPQSNRLSTPDAVPGSYPSPPRSDNPSTSTLRTRAPPAHLAESSSRLAAQLYTLLRPLLGLGVPLNTSARPLPLPEKARMIRHLHALILRAAAIATTMRLDPTTIYYFPPTAKDDVHDDASMIPVNERTMCATNPIDWSWHPAPKSPAEGHTEAEMMEAWGWKPLVRVICFEGVVAYRRGGWTHEERGWWDRGLRSHRVSRSRVALRWGRQRRFGRAGDGDGDGDGDGGFRELEEFVPGRQGEKVKRKRLLFF